LLNELETAEKRGGKSAELYYELAETHFKQGKPKEAIAYCNKALNAAPLENQRINILNLRGWAYALPVATPDKRPDDEGKFPDYVKAAKDFKDVLDMAPKNPEAPTGLGYVYARTGKFTEAQNEAARAMVHGADNDLVLHNVACIYAELSVFDKIKAQLHADMALTYIHRELELNPKTLEAIQEESSFVSLRSRKDFQKLLEKKK
jgi:tetratricopeptide (TPR) repeat protein